MWGQGGSGNPGNHRDVLGCARGGPSQGRGGHGSSSRAATRQGLARKYTAASPPHGLRGLALPVRRSVNILWKVWEASEAESFRPGPAYSVAVGEAREGALSPGRALSVSGTGGSAFPRTS